MSVAEARAPLTSFHRAARAFLRKLKPRIGTAAIDADTMRSIYRVRRTLRRCARDRAEFQDRCVEGGVVRTSVAEKHRHLHALALYRGLADDAELLAAAIEAAGVASSSAPDAPSAAAAAAASPSPMSTFSPTAEDEDDEEDPFATDVASSAPAPAAIVKTRRKGKKKKKKIPTSAAAAGDDTDLDALLAEMNIAPRRYDPLSDQFAVLRPLDPDVASNVRPDEEAAGYITWTHYPGLRIRTDGLRRLLASAHGLMFVAVATVLQGIADIGRGHENSRRRLIADDAVEIFSVALGSLHADARLMVEADQHAARRLMDHCFDMVRPNGPPRGGPRSTRLLNDLNVWGAACAYDMSAINLTEDRRDPAGGFVELHRFLPLGDYGDRPYTPAECAAVGRAVAEQNWVVKCARSDWSSLPDILVPVMARFRRPDVVLTDVTAFCKTAPRLSAEEAKEHGSRRPGLPVPPPELEDRVVARMVLHVPNDAPEADMIIHMVPALVQANRLRGRSSLHIPGISGHRYDPAIRVLQMLSFPHRDLKLEAVTRLAC